MTSRSELLRYLLIGQVLIPALINTVINLLFGISTAAGRDSIPLWTVQGGAVPDWIATSILLPFITCLIATPIVRRQVRNGSAPDIPADTIMKCLSRISRRPIWIAAIFWAIAGVTCCAVPIWLITRVFPAGTVPAAIFIAIKCLLAVALGSLVTPLIAVSVIVAAQTTRNDD